MDYYDNPLTPSMGNFSMAETNPFEYSFQPAKQDMHQQHVMATSPVYQQLPPSPQTSVNSSPRQSVHEDNSVDESNSVSPKVRTRSRSTTGSVQSQKRKLDAVDNDNEEDAEEKRRKFLERNRQAASKCRQKKKAWMQDLEQRSDEIINRNKALHETVSMLKEEVLFLKNQLLTHRGCDCTVVKNYIQTSGTFSNFLSGSQQRSDGYRPNPYSCA
ncbi:Transcription factor, variant 2 [Umbelopsis sp. WA50703]